MGFPYLTNNMGFKVVAITIVGWEVKYDKLVEHLIQHRVGTCCGRYITNRRTGRVRVVPRGRRQRGAPLPLSSSAGVPPTPSPPSSQGSQGEESFEEDEAMAAATQPDYACQCFCGNGACWDNFAEGITIPQDAWIVQTMSDVNMADHEARYHISLVPPNRPAKLSELEEISHEARAAVRAFAVLLGARNKEARVYAALSEEHCESQT